METAVEKLNLCISLSEDESLELLKNVPGITGRTCLHAETVSSIPRSSSKTSRVKAGIIVKKAKRALVKYKDVKLGPWLILCRPAGALRQSVC